MKTKKQLKSEKLKKQRRSLPLNFILGPISISHQMQLDAYLLILSKYARLQKMHNFFLTQVNPWTVENWYIIFKESRSTDTDRHWGPNILRGLVGFSNDYDSLDSIQALKALPNFVELKSLHELEQHLNGKDLPNMSLDKRIGNKKVQKPRLHPPVLYKKTARSSKKNAD